MPATPLQPTSETLGRFLRDSRSRLEAPSDGGRRRTPGLRREEVAARAGVSVTWYTWLEQGRGGAPSEAVLERLARALELDSRGRELLFLLGRERPPPPRRAPAPPVPTSVQAVLSALHLSPAFVRTPIWDVVAWNPAAAAVLAEPGDPQFQERNILRRMFSRGSAMAGFADWEAGARYAIGGFRIDVARAGRTAEAEALIAELRAASPEFDRLWAEADPRGEPPHLKRLWRPEVGPITVSAAAFAIEGASGLTMIVFSPAEEADRRAVARLLALGVGAAATPPAPAPALARLAG